MAKKKKKKDDAPATGPRIIATNRRARFDYHIEETYEAGIALTGTEIKAIRQNLVNLREGFVLIRDGEAWLLNVHISHYKSGNRNNHDETRRRKLLLHSREINNIYSQVTQKNWTIVPLRLYLNGKGLAKVEIALVRGKKNYDKRTDIAKRDSQRDIQRALKNYNS
ncbi:MAG: SsrA-binding protein SmpB [Chloroflexota bacterium]